MLAGIGADADRPADVVEDDRRFGERARQLGQLVDLRVIEPGVEGEPEAAEDGEALAERLVAEQSLAAGCRPDCGWRHPRPRR